MIFCTPYKNGAASSGGGAAANALGAHNNISDANGKWKANKTPGDGRLSAGRAWWVTNGKTLRQA